MMIFAGMQRKFVLNIILALILNLLIKPFYILGIDAEVLNQVEKYHPGSYGEYFSLLGLTFIFNIFLDIGITNYNSKNIAQHGFLVKKYFSKLIGVRMLLALSYIGILFVAAIVFNYTSYQLKLLLVLGFNQVLVAFILFIRSNLTGLMKFTQDSLLSVVDRILLIGMGVIYFWGGIFDAPLRIEWFVFAQTFAYLITLGIGMYFLRKDVRLFKVGVSKTMSLAVLKQSYPYALLILLMMVYYRVDSVMLERMLDDGGVQATTYAKGFRFFEAYNMIGYLFAGMLLPLFAKLIKEKNKKELSDLLYLGMNLLLSISIILSLSSFMLSKEIIQWRFHDSGEELYHSALSFSLLMGCFFSVTITYVFGTILTANGSLKVLNFIAFFGVILNLTLNFFMIPKYGSVGAAAASFVTQFLTAVIQMIAAFKVIELEFKLTPFLRLSVLLITFLLVANIIQNHLGVHWGIKFILFLVMGGGFAMLTKSVNLPYLIKLLQSRQ